MGIAAGGSHTCALMTNHGMKCWGRNSNGQIGDNNQTNRLMPVDVLFLTSGVAAIAGGGLHTCALTMGNAAMCWGYNAQGQVGDGTTIDRWIPVGVSGLTNGVAAIAAGSAGNPANLHTCALLMSGSVKCWGFNQYGQLGNGQSGTNQFGQGIYSDTPVDVVGFLISSYLPYISSSS
jgi:alpha-tubulin suppressor-like RCC1 family protein